MLVVGQEFVIAGCYPSASLQVVEKLLGQVALPVERIVIATRRFALCAVRLEGG